MTIAESIQGRGNAHWELHWSVGIQASGLGLGLLATGKVICSTLAQGCLRVHFKVQHQRHHCGHTTTAHGKDRWIQPGKSRGAWQQHLPPCSGAAVLHPPRVPEPLCSSTVATHGAEVATQGG